MPVAASKYATGCHAFEVIEEVREHSLLLDAIAERLSAVPRLFAANSKSVSRAVS